MSNENGQNSKIQRGSRGPMGMGGPVQKAKDFKGTLKRLLKYLKPHRIKLIIVVIFAIASTVFSITAPKVTSKAMNKLQDGYMAGKVITEMSDGQSEARVQILDNMAKVQSDMIITIMDKMGDAQKTAGTEIIDKMSDAQSKALNQMYTEMAKAQSSAKNNVVSQMASAQNSLITTLNTMMTAPVPEGETPTQMDAATLKSIESILALPKISDTKGTSNKISTTVKFIDLLSQMPSIPGSGSNVDPATLKTLKSVLNTKSISSSTNKKSTTLNFIGILNDMPKTSQTASLNTAKKLINAKMISTGKSYKDKATLTISFVKLLQDMPNSSNSVEGMDKEGLNTIVDLLQLPLIQEMNTPNEKKENTLKLIKVLKELPEDKEKNQTQNEDAIDIKSLDSVTALLNMEDIGSIDDETSKLEALDQMLVLLQDMPDMESDEESTEEVNPEDIDAIREFIALPLLKTIESPEEKAVVTRKIMDLGSQMSSMADGPESPDSEIDLTDEQVDGVITAIEETNGKIDFTYIGQIALILIAMYVISALFSLVMGLVMSGVSQKTVRDLRQEVDQKFARLPLKYFDIHPHGDMLSRVTNDVDTIATTLQQSLTQMITSVISIIGFIIMMLTISPTLTIIVIATLPLYIVVTVSIAKKSQKHFAAQQKELGDLSGHVEEMYTGHKIVKVFNHEEESVGKFNKVNDRLYEASWKAQFVSGIMFPLMNFISNIGYVLISVVGGIWITKDLLKIGDMLAFIQYSRSFTMPIVQTANIANVIQSTIACAERVFEVLDEEEELQDDIDAVILENPQGNVTFENVSFSYTEEVTLIENMNLKVEKGHTVAIVGPTGAGKTTLVNLLMRFYEIQDGKITVDGIDTRMIKRNKLRRMFGMVLQDTWLFYGTIRDNIAYGKDATEEQIIEAAKAAHADHFIRTLPEGYDTVLNEEGTNISQGQKQLITIARAILADPTILILDEATSSVDTRTEVLIQKAMNNLMKGRTSFVIAHRLSTIRDAETILVMNNGSIIEMGNHKELLDKHGFYNDLYQSQFAE